MAPEWSEEFVFTNEAIRQHAPTAPGVYEIRQSVEYPRYAGKTRVLKIGKSDSNMQQELLNHLQRHTAANRLARIRKRQGIQVSFRFVVLDTAQATSREKGLLREFEDQHWDLPLLNDQRGYRRGEDRHYRGA